MADYRWNELDNARGYDEAAEHVHPYYREIQDVILDHLPLSLESDEWIVDLGGGSGRLAKCILQRWPSVKVWVIDQSEPFLTLANERLQCFGQRAVCRRARLQSDWSRHLPGPPRAIVSMSAIHHLDSAEKQRLYEQSACCLAPSGVFLNGDEVRPLRDEDYLTECRRWADHMRRVMDAGLVPERFHSALHGWIARNVQQFGTPRVSGEDCHETAEAQLGYVTSAGLTEAQVVWQRNLWSVLCARKP